MKYKILYTHMKIFHTMYWSIQTVINAHHEATFSQTLQAVETVKRSTMAAEMVKYPNCVKVVKVVV